MSDISLDLAPGKTVRVRLSDWEFNEFNKAAVFAKRHGAIVYGDIGEYMVFATRYFINDQKEAAAFFAKRMLEEKSRTEPTHIMKRATREFENMTEELDSWGEVNGRP